MNSVRLDNLSLKCQRISSSGYKAIRIRKIEFVERLSSFEYDRFNRFYKQTSKVTAKQTRAKHIIYANRRKIMNNMLILVLTQNTINPK